jgi:hypothetical protein
VTLAQIVDLREELLRNDAYIDTGKIHIGLGSRKNFSKYLDFLRVGAAEGHGLSHLLTKEENSETPTDSEGADLESNLNANDGSQVSGHVSTTKTTEGRTFDDSNGDSVKGEKEEAFYIPTPDEDVEQTHEGESFEDLNGHSAEEGDTVYIPALDQDTDQAHEAEPSEPTLAESLNEAGNTPASKDSQNPEVDPQETAPISGEVHPDLEEEDLIDYSDEELDEAISPKRSSSANNGTLSHSLQFPCRLPKVCYCSSCSRLLARNREINKDTERPKSGSGLPERKSPEQSSEQPLTCTNETQEDDGVEASGLDYDEYNEELETVVNGGEDYQPEFQDFTGDGDAQEEQFHVEGDEFSQEVGDKGQSNEGDESTFADPDIQSFGDELGLADGDDPDDLLNFEGDEALQTAQDFELSGDFHVEVSQDTLAPEVGEEQDETVESSATADFDEIQYEDLEGNAANGANEPPSLNREPETNTNIEDEDEIGYEDDEEDIEDENGQDPALSTLPATTDLATANGKRSRAEESDDAASATTKGMYHSSIPNNRIS